MAAFASALFDEASRLQLADDFLPWTSKGVRCPHFAFSVGTALDAVRQRPRSSSVTGDGGSSAATTALR